MATISHFQEANRLLVAKDYPGAVRSYLLHAEGFPAEAAQAYAGAAECCLRSNIIQAPISIASGISLVSQGDLRGAEYYFRLALQADPKNAKALWGLSELLSDSSDERRELLERSAAVMPGTLNLVALGDYYRSRLKDFDRAYTLYRQAVEHAPRDQTAYLRLNDVCRRLERPEEAKEWSSRWKEAKSRKRSVDGKA